MVLRSKAYRAVMWQLFRFAVVGSSAALVHFFTVVALVEAGWLSPLVANVIAFLIALQVSYWGHRSWTFAHSQQRHLTAFSRLLVVSTLAFIANEGLFYLLMKQLSLPYPVALMIVLSILPLAVFSLHKCWVFNHGKDQE